MKRIHQGFFVVSLLVLLQTAPALADVTSIIGGISCGNPDCQPTGAVPVLQGKRTVLLVDGQDVNFADKNNVDVTGGGVSARIIRDHLVSPKFGIGTGRAEVELNVSDDAAPGERTVTLNHNGCIGCPRKYKFKILIVRDGKVTDVDVPSPSQFFQQVDITFTGQRIGNAGASLLGFPGGTTAQVIESQSNESRAVVRLNFSSSRAEANGQIKLFDKACGVRCVVHNEVYDGLTNSQATNITVLGPNAVKEITFPDGNSVRVGGLLTIQINLVRPAKTGLNLPGLVPIKGGATNQGGEIVHWQLVPSGVFEAAPGSGTIFSPTGLNQVRIPGGNTLVRLTVRLKEAPGGCPLQQGCSAEVQTRMGNINTDQPPFFKSARFTIFRGQ
jgi:hypothetical protein